MTAGTADKVALYWYAEPSVLTHRSWCGDYTHTHARMHMNCMHATLTRTHAPTHTRNTHTYTRSYACTHACTHHPTNTLSRSSAQPTRACAHIRP